MRFNELNLGYTLFQEIDFLKSHVHLLYGVVRFKS